ncbi:25941_t:CDS:2 [Gigaspora margarita]|uniref:25941_t:CDS:1 n=1 Tax=Gigaspora margarita TaxID=4874 RepID=A0ABN7UV03_GIGMA|nr:25941_t:CDS:2 [Gigaspora margarita]
MGEQSFEQLKNYVETICLVNNASISYYYHYEQQSNGSVVNAIAIADFGTDIHGENSDRTNMVFGETNIKYYYNVAMGKSHIRFWGHPIIDVFKLGMWAYANLFLWNVCYIFGWVVTRISWSSPGLFFSEIIIYILLAFWNLIIPFCTYFISENEKRIKILGIVFFGLLLLALLKLLEKISEVFVWIFSNGWFVWIHKNFIKYYIDPCKNHDGSCCYGVRSTKSIISINIYQDSPPPYSLNEDRLQIPENIHNI